MSNFTPGPWVVTAHPVPGVDVFAVGEPMADEELQYSLSHTVCYQNAEANARLIAAAPELLEALIEAVECGMVPISSAVEGGASAYSAQVRCADKIRSAIAKATGGAA